jgi:hypothetical protein
VHAATKRFEIWLKGLLAAGFRFNNGVCSSPQITGGSFVDNNASGCGNSGPNVQLSFQQRPFHV